MTSSLRSPEGRVRSSGGYHWWRVPEEVWCAVDVRQRKRVPTAVPTAATNVCSFAEVFKARGLRVVSTVRLTLVSRQEDAAGLSLLNSSAHVAGRNRQVLVPNVAAKAEHAA